MARGEAGFTLVELMISIVVVGVLTGLSAMGAQKYIAHAKTTEARQNVSQMAQNAAMAFAKEKEGAASSAGIIAINHQVCPSATDSVPKTVGEVASQRYQSTTADWNVPAWQCLAFGLTGPQYFQYSYQGGTGTDNNKFVAYATGDLNATTAGTASANTSQVRYTINGVGNKSDGTVAIGPMVEETGTSTPAP